MMSKIGEFSKVGPNMAQFLEKVGEDFLESGGIGYADGDGNGGTDYYSKSWEKSLDWC